MYLTKKRLWLLQIAIFSMAACLSNSKSQAQDSLSTAINMAKAAGHTTLHIHRRSNDDGADDTVAEMLKLYSVVVVTPIESKVFRDGNTINTWYRFRVVETLSSAPKCLECSSPIAAPKGLSIASANEILVPFFGGTVTVDGIRVTMKGDYDVLPQQGDTYILFVDKYPDGRAFLGGGEAGVYRLAGNQLQPIGSRNVNLKRDILSSGSIEALRERLTTTQTSQH